MKHLYFVLLLSLAGAAQLHAQRTLSDSARISLLTGSAGKDLYSIFGHSAFHVYDPVNQVDRCYNYGTFDLEQPNFYLLFMQGKLNYFLNPEPYRALVRGYAYEQRNLQEQVLNLDDSMKQRLFELLQENLREENRYYLYDFFYDNCSTRIRDMMQSLYAGKLQFNYDSLPTGMTMRQLLHTKLGAIPWTRFGMDLLLGQPTDKVATPDDFMFLPDYLHDIFGRTRLPNGEPLVAREWITPDAPYPPPNSRPPFYAKPWFVLLLISLLTLPLLRTHRGARWVERVLALVLGGAGALMLIMWAGTDHVTTKNNWNLLWALPTHLIFGFGAWRRYHWMAAGVLAGCCLLGWFFIPQRMPPEAIPLLLVVMALAYRNWRTPFTLNTTGKDGLHFEKPAVTTG